TRCSRGGAYGLRSVLSFEPGSCVMREPPSWPPLRRARSVPLGGRSAPARRRVVPRGDGRPTASTPPRSRPPSSRRSTTGRPPADVADDAVPSFAEVAPAQVVAVERQRLARQERPFRVDVETLHAGAARHQKLARADRLDELPVEGHPVGPALRVALIPGHD